MKEDFHFSGHLIESAIYMVHEKRAKDECDATSLENLARIVLSNWKYIKAGIEIQTDTMRQLNDRAEELIRALSRINGVLGPLESARNIPTVTQAREIALSALAGRVVNVSLPAGPGDGEGHSEGVREKRRPSQGIASAPCTGNAAQPLSVEFDPKEILRIAIEADDPATFSPTVPDLKIIARVLRAMANGTCAKGDMCSASPTGEAASVPSHQEKTP